MVLAPAGAVRFILASETSACVPKSPRESRVILDVHGFVSVTLPSIAESHK